MSRVASFFRFLVRLGRARAFRVILALLAGLWGFDRLIWGWTQHSFFASVGMESQFWQGFWAPLQLFGAFFLTCLVLIALLLRPFAPRAKAPELEVAAPPLRGILTGFAPLRSRIYPVSHALALVFALVLALDFSRHGQQWLDLQRGEKFGFGYLGFDASVWTTFLPLWMPWLIGLWDFSLALGFLALVTGILRALPALAAHNSAPPALARVLWRGGALILALRALLYVSQIVDLPRGTPLSTGAVFVLAPIWAFGALWCALASASFLRRALRKTAPFPPRAGDKIMRPVILGLTALFLPSLLGVLTLPLRAILPETAFFQSARERATRFAWKLPREREIGVSATGKIAVSEPIERAFSAWDETAILATRPQPIYRGERLVTWQNATLEFQNGAWSALLAGQNVTTASPTTSREVGKNTALAMERVAASGSIIEDKGEPIPVADAVFGLEGPPLFAQSGGISLRSAPLKWAWTWRDRDLFLPVDAALAPHLLTARGARARAQILAPSLTPLGAPRLHLEAGKPVWTLDLGALSPNFPGAMRGVKGDFAGANALLSQVKMRLDARTGAVKFEKSVVGKSGTVPSGSVLLRAQAEVLAMLRGQENVIFGPTRGLDRSGQSVWRAVVAEKDALEVLEADDYGMEVERVKGDLRARLNAIDTARGENPESQTITAGEPAVWRDARAPGGFWVARAFFAAPRADLRAAERDATSEGEKAPRALVLWRVAWTALAPDSRVGIGATPRAARLDFQGAAPEPATESTPEARAGSASPLNSKALSGAAKTDVAQLEVEALETHRALEEAAKRGDWKTFGALSGRQKALLERLVAARGASRSAAPKP